MALSSADIQKLVENALHNPKNLATELELNEYANAAVFAFQRADVDFSDSLSIKELRILCSEMGLPMEDDEEEGTRALMKIDADDSGQISQEEWIGWWLKRVSSLPNPLKQQEAIAVNTFRKYDFDGSGSLDCSELNELIYSLGAKFSKEEIVEVTRQLDTDGSGIIELNEFVDWWVQRSAKSRSSGGLIGMKLRKLARKAAQIYFTDIFTAVWNNDILLVRTFLESDRRIGSSSDVSEYGDGWMPLHYACYRGYLAIVKELVDSGVNINAVNDLGFSSLFYAAQNGHLEICEFLLSNGADPGVSGSVPDGNIFMCAVDHSVDNEDLKLLFESQRSCAPPDQPPSDRIFASIKEGKGILSIELPPLRSFSQLPIKRWHLMISTAAAPSKEAPSDSFEMYADGLDPSKSRGNNENIVQVTIDKKWLSSKILSDGSLPNFILKISAINPLDAESPFSDDVKVSIDSTVSKIMSTSLSVSHSKMEENVNDDYLEDGYDTNDGEEQIENDAVETSRRERDEDGEDIDNVDELK